MLQESAPDPGLTVRESLELYAGYYSNPRSVTETIALVGLAGKADRRATSLSGGERRRLDFGARPDRRPRTDLPRRADNRLRPLRTARSLGRDRRACATSARRSS